MDAVGLVPDRVRHRDLGARAWESKAKGMKVEAVGFLRPAVLEYDVNRLWKLAEPFMVAVMLDGRNQLVMVPVGFVTDLASVPRALWDLFPPEGRYTEAAIVHDYLYSVQGRLPVPGSVQFGRADADQVLLKGMEACGEGRVARRTIWLAVRAFGGGHWKVR